MDKLMNYYFTTVLFIGLLALALCMKPGGY